MKIRTIKNKILPALFLAMILAGPGWAHDLWVTKTDEGYAVMRGHIPDRFDPYDPTCMQEPAAWDAKGAPLSLERTDGKERVMLQFPSDPALVAAVSKWGYRIIDNQGKKQFLSRVEAVEKGIKVKEAFYSTQFSKTLFSFSETFTRPLGVKFEVIPLKNPLTLRPGEELPVQVFFDGEPLAGGKIERGKKMDPMETDANGTARIPVQASGWQKILVTHDIPSPERQDIDYYKYFAFLVFELK